MCSQLKHKCQLYVKVYNNACVDDVGGISEDETGGVNDDDGAFVGCDDLKGVCNDGWGVIGEVIPPNYESWSMRTSANDVSIWRIYKSIESFTIIWSATCDIVFDVVPILSCCSTTLQAQCVSYVEPLSLYPGTHRCQSNLASHQWWTHSIVLSKI